MMLQAAGRRARTREKREETASAREALRHLRPIVIGAKLDRLWHGKPSRRVAGALHFKRVDEGRVAKRAFRAGGIGVFSPAVTDDKRVDHVLQGAPDVQEGRAFGGHQPFMAVARVKIRVQRRKVQRDVPRRMRAVDHRQPFLLACLRRCCGSLSSGPMHLFDR